MNRWLNVVAEERPQRPFDYLAQTCANWATLAEGEAAAPTPTWPTAPREAMNELIEREIVTAWQRKYPPRVVPGGTEYVVSGLQGEFESLNGVYAFDDSEPKQRPGFTRPFHQINGDGTLEYVEATARWLLTACYTGSGYFCKSSAAVPPLSGWQAIAGTAPAPSLSRKAPSQAAAAGAAAPAADAPPQQRRPVAAAAMGRSCSY